MLELQVGHMIAITCILFYGSLILLPLHADFRDFLSINQSLGGFGNSKRRHCFNVIITDDDVREDAETFTVTLEKPFTGNLLISPAVVTVTILDNDGM